MQKKVNLVTMKNVIYSVMFIMIIYIVGMACNIAGLTDSQSAIPMLIGMFVVLGLFISRKGNKGE